MNNYFVFGYGAEVAGGGADFRPEIAANYEDLYDLRDDFENGDFSKLPNFPEEAKDLDIITGEDSSLYIGAWAQMPFDAPTWTKESLEKAVEAMGRYLYGDNCKLVCDRIAYAWSED